MGHPNQAEPGSRARGVTARKRLSQPRTLDALSLRSLNPSDDFIISPRTKEGGVPRSPLAFFRSAYLGYHAPDLQSSGRKAHGCGRGRGREDEDLRHAMTIRGIATQETCAAHGEYESIVDVQAGTHVEADPEARGLLLRLGSLVQNRMGSTTSLWKATCPTRHLGSGSRETRLGEHYRTRPLPNCRHDIDLDNSAPEKADVQSLDD